jgi:hypothetical protein
MMGFAFTLAPDTHNTDLITMAETVTAITIARMNIGGSGGTGTIIGTITIETTIGIDAYRTRFAANTRSGFSNAPDREVLVGTRYPVSQLPAAGRP